MSAGINVTGLASGIDTSAIVTQLMAIERQPSTLLQGRIDAANARIAALQETRSRLDALRTAGQGLRAAGLFTPRPVATSSDVARVSVTATDVAVATSYAVTVEQLARADVVTQGTALATAGAADVLHLATGSGTTHVSVSAGDTIDTIASRVNAAHGGVTASVVQGRLRLTANETGSAGAIAVTSDGSLAGDLAFGHTLAGQDARFTVDGTAYTRSSNSISDVLVGATITLKASTPTPLTISTNPSAVDADAVVGQVRALVTAYNAVIDGVNAAVTDRKGPFFSDSLLTGIRDRLQAATQDTSAIGLSTGAPTGTFTHESLTGRLTVDEGRLRAAVGSDQAAVEALASRLDTVIGDLTGVTGTLAGRLGAEAARAAAYQSSIDQMSVRLADRERLLRAQFTAMERSLSQLQDMQSRFGAQFAASLA